jgi:hypothetical protein
MEAAMDYFHEFFDAGGGFGGADEGEVEKRQVDGCDLPFIRWALF